MAFNILMGSRRGLNPTQKRIRAIFGGLSGSHCRSAFVYCCFIIIFLSFISFLFFLRYTSYYDKGSTLQPFYIPGNNHSRFITLHYFFHNDYAYELLLWLLSFSLYKDGEAEEEESGAVA